MQTVSNDQVRAWLQTVKAFADAIREAGPGGIGKGSLYAMAVHVMDLATFEKMISLLTSSGMVRQEPSFRLVWSENVQRRD